MHDSFNKLFKDFKFQFVEHNIPRKTISLSEKFVTVIKKYENENILGQPNLHQ
jgi:hypothetical protein